MLSFEISGISPSAQLRYDVDRKNLDTRFQCGLCGLAGGAKGLGVCASEQYHKCRFTLSRHFPIILVRVQEGRSRQNGRGTVKSSAIYRGFLLS